MIRNLKSDENRKRASASKKQPKRVIAANKASRDGEVMTINAIKNRFDKEWVLIGDPVCAKNLNVKKGKVLWHCKDRDELYEQAVKLQPRNFAVLYIGERPKDLVYML